MEVFYDKSLYYHLEQCFMFFLLYLFLTSSLLGNTKKSLHCLAIISFHLCPFKLLIVKLLPGQSRRDALQRLPIFLLDGRIWPMI